MKAIGCALAVALTGAPITFAPEPAKGGRTREPALTGSWYPEGRAHLLSAAHLLMRVASPAAIGRFCLVPILVGETSAEDSCRGHGVFAAWMAVGERRFFGVSCSSRGLS